MGKLIKLQEGSIQTKQGPVLVKTIDLINAALNNAPEKGLSIADFRSRARFDRNIESQLAEIAKRDFVAGAAVNLELDDQDFSTLKEAVTPMRWTVIGKIVSDFVLAFDEPETEEAKPEVADFKPMSVASE